MLVEHIVNIFVLRPAQHGIGVIAVDENSFAISSGEFPSKRNARRHTGIKKLVKSHHIGVLIGLLCIPVSSKQSIKFTILVRSHHIGVLVGMLGISVSAKQPKIFTYSISWGVAH